MVGDQRVDGVGALDAGQVRGGVQHLEPRARDGGGDRLARARAGSTGPGARPPPASARVMPGRPPRRSMAAIASAAARVALGRRSAAIMARYRATTSGCDGGEGRREPPCRAPRRRRPRARRAARTAAARSCQPRRRRQVRRGAEQDQPVDPLGRVDGQPLADHAADRQPAVGHAGEAQPVEHGQHVAAEVVDRVGAGRAPASRRGRDGRSGSPGASAESSRQLRLPHLQRRAQRAAQQQRRARRRAPLTA